jgi:hypothetical protein
MRYLSLVLALGACKPIQEAPENLDDALHALWDLYPEGADEDIAIVTDALPLLVDLEALEDKATDGTQSRLVDEDLDRVDLFAPDDDEGTWARPDAASARPLFLLNVFQCTRAQLEPLLYALDQQSQYGSYDDYSRTYTSDIDAFVGGAPTITWTADASASNIATGSYSQVLHGGLRRVPMRAFDADDAQAGLFDDSHFLLARTWIPFPADTERDNVSFDQDYQLEAYLPLTEGRMLHLYGVWRQMDLGGLGDMENDSVARITLNGLLDWDKTTEALCAE